ncbi:glycosyl hydrolase family 65 protein [Streptomyces zhihengii]|uniref:glycosyl hydrolase family 65 protein n=1 Tax=Streptomyces zhihengii TaxID=1818004 RepID=UPI00363BBF2A
MSDTGMTPADWLLPVTAAGPRQAAYAEALLHLANSHQGLRVPLDVDDPHSEPGFFLRDVYDAGVGVDREIVNLPHPLGLRVRQGYERLRPDGPATRTLDMRDGVVRSTTPLTGPNGNRVLLTTVTAVHATRPSVGVMTGTLRVPAGVSSLALDVFWDNTRGNAYLGGAVPELAMVHTLVDGVAHRGDAVQLDCRLTGTGERLLLTADTRCERVARRIPLTEFRRWGQTMVLDTQARGGTAEVRFDLVWQAGRAQDMADEVRGAGAGADELLAEHRAEWHRRWRAHGITVDGDPEVQEAVRYCQFQLLQHELPARTSAVTPARGLSGCYHSGATFFDTELHKDAFWAWTVPKVARAHLVFRHEHLPEAREFARTTGFAGARFPEAANDAGRENGPHRLLDYPENRDITEWSVREVLHNSADVAYAVHRYHRVTGDTGFLTARGAELVLETARFAASAFTWDDATGAHVVRSVMGPDEYHYHVDNNHFTNAMLRWNLVYALALLDGTEGLSAREAAALARRLGITQEERRHWSRIARSVLIPEPLDGEVPAQHEGYAALPDCPPRAPGHGPSARLSEEERALADDLQPFPTRLVKQADILLLAHLLPEVFDPATLARAYDYYEPRTAHESSLSAAPHGVVAARLGRADAALAFLSRAARYNLDYTPREDYRNGLHLSAYAGAWQILVEGFLGATPVDKDTLALAPRLPPAWRELTVPLAYQGRRLIVCLRRDGPSVRLLSGTKLRVRVNDA